MVLVEPGSNRLNNTIIAITSLGHALCHVAMLVLPVVLAPIGREYGLSLTEVTAVGTAAYLLYGFGAVPAGILTRFLGSRTMLLAYFTGIGTGALLVALAPSFAWFVAGMVLLGLAASIYHVAGPTLISHRSQKTGRAFGIHGIAGSAGITMAPLVAGLLAGWLGWRAAYLVLALPAVVGVALALAMARVDGNGPPNDASGEIAGNRTDTTAKRRLLVFVLLLFVLAINGLVYRATLTIFPMHLSDRISLAALPDVVTGGVLASAVLAFGMVGMYAVGSAADRVDRFRLYALLFAVVAPLLVIIGVAQGVLLLAASVSFSLFYFPCQPVENSILGTYVPPHLVSSIFALKFVITFGLGSLGSVGAGYVVERMGTTPLFVMLGGATVVSFAVAFAASVIRRAAPPHEPGSDPTRSRVDRVPEAPLL